MKDKSKTIAKLMGGFVWEGEVYVRKEIKYDACMDCAFVDRSIAFCNIPEFKKAASAVTGDRRTNAIWVHIKQNHEQQT